MPQEIFLPVLFFFVALFYSSVGFGGGSSYLAILSLFITEFFIIRSTALILNVLVVSIGTLLFYRNKVFDWKEFWPFIVLSIPLSYLGAQLQLSEAVFFIILGSGLIGSGIFMLIKYLNIPVSSRKLRLRQKLTLGGAVGFLAGVSGIGGGIFLSPILHLFNWSNARTIASLASTFILANSLAGLIGLISSGKFQVNETLLGGLSIAVIVGGMTGSYLTNKKFNTKWIGILTAVLVLYVGIRLILIHGFGVVY